MAMDIDEEEDEEWSMPDMPDTPDMSLLPISMSILGRGIDVKKVIYGSNRDGL